MAITVSRCSCCNVKTDDLDRAGLCGPCAAGEHYVHCKKNAAPPAAAKAPEVLPPPPKAPPELKEPAPPAPAVAAEVVTEQTAVAKAEPAGPPAKARSIEASARGLVLANLDDMYRFAKIVVAAGMAPKSLDTPEKALVAIQFGLEVGLSPMQSIQNVYVVGGRPALHSDAPKAIIEASGLMEDFDEWYEHKGQRVEGWPSDPEPETAAVCYSKRRGRERGLTTRFSWADAKKARLDKKDGPWQDYPGRQMKFRARQFNLRDNFPDRVKGFADQSEAGDIVFVEQVRDPATIPMPRQLEPKAETPAS